MVGTPRPEGLDALLSPKAIAIVGASGDPARIGGRPIRYARDMGYGGAIYPVNPTRAEIQGLKAYPTLASIPGEIDCVVIAVAPDLAEAAIADAAAKGARGAIVFTAAYAEAGPEGVIRQERLTALGRKHGLRILGPNCLGIFNAATGHAATFGSFLEGGNVPGGTIGIVSQSGAYASYLHVLARDRSLGVARWIATGNEADVTVADCIAHLAADPGVKVIAAYVEGVKDGPAFLAALESARAAGKPVVLIKVGRSERGAEAARSHTASLAGDDLVFDHLVRAAGAIRVLTTEALMDAVEGLSRRGPLPGTRLGIVTISGGAGVLMADAATDVGLDVPPMPPETAARLKAENPLGSFANPLDVTAQAFNDPSLVGKTLKAIFAEGHMDAVAAFFMTWIASPVMGPRMQAEIEGALVGHEHRTVALAVTAPRNVLDAYRAKGIICLEDPSRVVAMLGAMAEAGRALAMPGSASIDLIGVPCLDGTESDEASAKAFLAKAGLTVLPEMVAATPQEAAAAAMGFGRPVALKILSADIAHKSDVGGVALNIAPDDALAAATTMMARVTAAKPTADIKGFLVSPMAGDGIELIVAARMDPIFGPIVMVGLGGVFVEVMKDVVFAAAPIDEEAAAALIDRLKGRVLLDGVRGRPGVNVGAAARAVTALSRVAAANHGRFDTIEINPLLVTATDAVMLDALITRQGGGHS